MELWLYLKRYGEIRQMLRHSDAGDDRGEIENPWSVGGGGLCTSFALQIPYYPILGVADEYLLRDRRYVDCVKLLCSSHEGCVILQGILIEEHKKRIRKDCV